MVNIYNSVQPQLCFSMLCCWVELESWDNYSSVKITFTAQL